MKLFNIHLVKDGDLKKYNSDMERKARDGKFENTRPLEDPTKSLGGDIIVVPYYPLNIGTLYDIAAYSDVLRTIIQNIRKEVFRRGYEIREKFSKKCTNETCRKEYTELVDFCEECGSAVRDPDPKQKEETENFIKNVNDNKQDIIDVSKMVNDDIETIDDGYMIAVNDYYWDDNGDLIGFTPVEIVRGHPIYMRIIADKTGKPGISSDGKKIMFCLEHRDTYVEDQERCPTCGKQMVNAHFRSQEYEGQYIYYSRDEVCHKSKYMPSMTYGFSNILAAWMKVVTLMDQDNYIMKYYSKQRPPRGLLFVNTPNIDGLEKAWQWMLDQFKLNPHMIPPIAIDRGQGSSGGGRFVEFIDFMRSLDEMQYTEQRNENRRQIGALYGVMPIYQADLSQGGGLNNEGLQITLTNRAMEDGQRTHNEGYFPWVMETVLRVTDYTLTLIKSEEKDEVAKEELMQKRMQNAEIMQRMGFEVSFNEDDLFEYGPLDEPVGKPEQAAPGGFGGLDFGAGGFTGQPEQQQEQQPQQQPPEFAGAPQDIQRSMKKDAAVTSSTPGVSNAVYGRRKKDVERYVHKVLTGIINKEKIDIPIEKAEADLPDIAEFISRNIYSKSFNGVSKSISELIKEYIVKAMVRGYPLGRVIKYVYKKGGKNISKFQAEVIARTEGQALKTTAREWSYKKVDPEGNFKFKWISISDDRQTDQCKSVAERTKNGVLMERLKEIIKEESDKAKGRGDLPKNYNVRDYNGHFQCRSTFVRAVD